LEKLIVKLVKIFTWFFLSLASIKILKVLFRSDNEEINQIDISKSGNIW